MSDTADTKQLPKDIAAEKGLVNVQIDGTWIQVPKGTRIIEACKIAKAEVPHYCYHPKLSSPGNCRMCLVQMGMPPRLAPGQDPEFNDEGYQEIGWMPRPIIACANTVGENMGIRTEGELVEECRRGVMEFLLINHPLDCPICDQAGECSLQEYSVEHGQGISNFLEAKVKKPKNVPIGPRIRLDDERCIMCSRCVRFMDEVGDDPVLGFSQRGTHTTLTVHPGKQLDSNYGLNTVDICPVGALTSNDFRFQMRVWFLKETKTIDTNCGTGCNTTVWTRGDQVYRVTPRENNDVNSSWMPDSHRLNFHYINAESRLTVPITKKNGNHEASSWEQAISTAAEGLKKYSGNQIGVIASSRQTNEELFMMRTLATELGADKLTTVERMGESDGKLISADCNPNTTGARLILKMGNPASKLSALREGVRKGSIKALVVFNENLFKEAGFTEKDLKKVEFIVSNHILENPTAHISDVILPGSSFAEKRGTMINVAGRLQRLNQACQAPGQARDDWEIIRDLIDAVKGTKETQFHLLEDVIKVFSNDIPEFGGITFSKIGDLGAQIAETGVTIPLVEKEKARVSKGEIVG